MAEMALARGGSPGTRARQPPGMESARRRSVWPAPGGRDPSAAWAHLPAPAPPAPATMGPLSNLSLFFGATTVTRQWAAFPRASADKGQKTQIPSSLPQHQGGGRGGSEGPAPHRENVCKSLKKHRCLAFFLKAAPRRRRVERADGGCSYGALGRGSQKPRALG